MTKVPYRFILDVHLGKLARYLRLCGFDTAFFNDISDSGIIDLSEKEDRIIITRDKELSASKKVRQSLLVKSQDPEEQLREIFRRYDLKDHTAPFTRCMKCNSPLAFADKEKIIDRLKPNTAKYYNRFMICTECDHVYWEGSHFLKMKNFLDDIITHKV